MLGPDARVFALTLLLVLDSSVLEPDLDLLLTQSQEVGDFDASQAREIHVLSKVSFQVHDLSRCESSSQS